MKIPVARDQAVGMGWLVASPFYADGIGAGAVSLAAEIERVVPAVVRMIGSRVGLVAGFSIWLGARSFAVVGLVRGEPGVLSFLVLEALRGRRRTALLEFLPGPEPSRRWKRVLRRARFALVERPATVRAMAVGQVLTAPERDLCAARFRVSNERFRHISWALMRYPAPLPPVHSDAAAVVASGRASCDWPTLFAAARSADWPLIVICGSADLAEVEALNHDRRAQVHSELSRTEHDAIVSAAAVYAVVLRRQKGPSAGHVRLMAAVGAGAPVVATESPGLDGYLIGGETALLVEPANPAALAAAIQRLIDDSELAARVREAAHRRAAEWTYNEYFEAIGELCRGLSEGSKPG